MPKYDSRLELAPRDVVARAIQDQMLSAGEPHVLLDVSHKPAAEVISHFPNIAARCAEDGIDITKDPIPVLPAQHYMCGGVSAGLRGETSIQGLFACGEVACSGLHGANRLASNSLLEGLVFADRAAGPSVAHAEYAARTCARQLHYAAASADFTGSKAAKPLAGPAAEWVAAKRAEIKTVMWSAAGIVRRVEGLQAAQASLAAAYLEVKAAAKQYGVSTPMVELMNLATVAELIVSCALQRRESRGLHFSPDFPEMAPEAMPSMIESSLKARFPDLYAGRGSLAGSVSGSSSSIVSMVPSAPSSPAPASRPSKGVAVRDMSLRAEADK
jgi:L-aspartate oxidase